MSYHAYGFGVEAGGECKFDASKGQVVCTGAASTGGGGPTGPKTAIGIGPQCGAGFRPNPMYASTPTALLPKFSFTPLCLPADKAAPAPAPAPAPPYMLKPGLLASLFGPKPVQTVLRSGQIVPMPLVEEKKPIWPWLLVGAVVLGGGGYYWYSRRQTQPAAAR